MLESGAVRRRKRCAVAVEMAHEIALAVAGHAVAQDKIVHAPADVDRVDLHVAVISEGRGDVGVRCIEPEDAAKEAAGNE